MTTVRDRLIDVILQAGVEFATDAVPAAHRLADTILDAAAGLADAIIDADASGVSTVVFDALGRSYVIHGEAS